MDFSGDNFTWTIIEGGETEVIKGTYSLDSEKITFKAEGGTSPAYPYKLEKKKLTITMDNIPMVFTK